MPLIVFRTRLRPEARERYAAHVERMVSLARAMPGFVSIKDYAAEDGERLALIEWESHETLAAWRDRPEHRAAQHAGRADYYDWYALDVCDVVRRSRFPAG